MTPSSCRTPDLAAARGSRRSGVGVAHNPTVRWNPERYLQRADERGRPFHDLVNRIGVDEPRRVVDLGCGPGNQTAVLAERWPDAQVLGIDSSPDMIEAAGAEVGPMRPNLAFEVGDIADWQPDAATDVVVSNAALQWVPGHDDVIRTWTAALSPGAWLAFQVPGNFGAPSHRLMRELATSPRWADQLAGSLAVHDEVLEPDGYANLLLDCGWRPDAWETTYLHLLEGPDPVLGWVRGTGLRPILAALSPSDTEEFEAEYARQLREVYPPRAQGTVFPFRRIFCVAHRI